MAETLIAVTGTTITLDESAGLQNAIATPAPAGDANDDDVLFSSIPATFAARLTALGASTPIGAAMSDGNVVTFSPTGVLGNIALTDAGGDPLNGVDSGYDTTDGQDILLYTDSNDNIVLGRAGGPTGDIVFAIYLEETGGVPPTGAKLWTVLYEAIDHGDDLNDHDSAIDLTGLIHVTAFEEQNFSFSEAPSGQNLFMMFGTASQAILVTGEDPANESAGENVSNEGDTVNTGKGGGATTLGTEGQQIKAQKALVITFVTGANSDFLVPNLSPTEATDESNIQFTGYVTGVKAAELTISQMTPGSASTTATVELLAYETSDGVGDNYIDSNPLVQGDTAVNITTGSVQVIRDGVDVVGTLGVSVDYTGDGAVITGVKEGDFIRYATDVAHNRVLIRNDQPASGPGSNVSFDLGGFRLTEVSGDTDEIGSNIFFEDAGPAITTGTNPAALTVDETTLATDASGSFAGLFNVAFGTDGPKDTDGIPGEDADAVTYALGIGAGGPNSGLVDTATNDPVFLFVSGDGTTITGKAGTDVIAAAAGPTVFVISVNANTGVVTLDQQRAVVHSPDTGPDQAITLADDKITLSATATDGDTDTDTQTENVGDRFTFKDDAPSAGANTAVQLDDETAQATLGTPNPGGTGDAVGTSATPSGTLSHTFGADGAGTVLLTGATLPVSGGFSQVLSGDNLTLTISQTQNGAPVDVIKIEITNAATGAYTVTHLNQVFHPTSSTTEEDLTFTINYQVTDKDGDTATSSINILADDDTPTVSAGTNPAALTVDDDDFSTDASVSFAGAFNVAFGSDGQASAGALTYTLGIGAAGPNSGLVDTLTGDPVFLFVSGDGSTITGRAGTDLAAAAAGPTVFVITISAAGLVTLDQQRSVVHPDDTSIDETKTLADNVITLTATATDGDTDTASHTENVGDRFAFKDDGPAITVNDTALAPGGGTATYATGAEGTWTDDPGNDGMKALNVTFDSYEIGANGSQTTSVSNSTFNKISTYVYSGSVIDDFNGDGNDDTVTFSLTFNGDGTYDVTVGTPPGSVSTFSTDQGSLDAGGPDPVRTLTIGTFDIVFSAVNATTATADILAFLDTDEATIEASAAYLSPAQMNVSTAGIGLGDNLFEGNATAGIDGDTTQGGKIDESFVIDPEGDVSSVKVIINDVTNGGYTPANEDLYYRIYYADGTVSATQKVLAGDLSPAGFHKVAFTIGDPEGPNEIDAVQLIMGRGTIKVPTIEFTASETFDPEALQLDFTATLFDGDDDPQDDSFSVDFAVPVA